MEQVVIGIIGSGFAARLHCGAYQYVHGAQAVLKAVASIAPDAREFAAEYGIQDVYGDYRELLRDDAIQVVDIIVPPAMHTSCVLAALRAGKHVICEKPLTGYFGGEGDETPVGLRVSRGKMLAAVRAEIATLREAVQSSGKRFMYAENWIYAPSIQKSAEFIRAKAGKQLFLKGEESHSGSHAGHAAHWSQNGGGSLIRQGCHPLSAALYLKQVEAAARGEDIRVKSVTADTACISKNLSERDRRHIASRPVDVEDWACVSVAFSDDTRALIVSGDMALGGVQNYIEAYSTDGVLRNSISPNNAMESYFVEEDGLADVYITEKTQNKTGWQKVFLSEHIARGYVGELQDFVECVRDNREPISGFELAAQTLEVIYAAYQSADEKRAVEMGAGL